jgi:PAS domain S-box-containing protein
MESHSPNPNRNLRDEKLVNELHSKYSRVIDFLPEMIFILDSNQRVLDHNSSATTVLGHESLIKEHVSKFAADVNGEKFVDLVSSHTNGGPFNARFVKASGDLMEVTVEVKAMRSGDETLSLLITRDVTEQRKRDLDYLRFSNVIERTINPIQITDARGLMIYVNPAFEQWSGFPKEELIGKNPKMLSSQKHTGQFWQKIWDTILTGKVWHGQVQNTRKDGRALDTDLLISPIVDDNGNVVGFLGAHRDISEQKILEQQLVQSQKMESIGTLAAGVAHEVGNPLTSISSLAQVIQRTTDDQFAREKLELIKNQVNRISRTIKDLVDFSRPSTHTSRSVDVSQIVRDALSIVKYGKKVQDISFVEEFAEDLPQPIVVPDQLTQVFINILMNAVDALDGKPGSITIVTGYRNGGIEIAVIDTGKGIAMEARKKIFDPFFTTKDVGKGSGLGLWVSYGIIKSFGGEIIVESNPGTGSTFRVFLPLQGR